MGGATIARPTYTRTDCMKLACVYCANRFAQRGTRFSSRRASIHLAFATALGIIGSSLVTKTQTSRPNSLFPSNLKEPGKLRKLGESREPRRQVLKRRKRKKMSR